MIDWNALIMGIMKNAGISQAEIARRCGVVRSTVTLLAQGKRKDPSWTFGDKLMKMARKYKVKVTKI